MFNKFQKVLIIVSTLVFLALFALGTGAQTGERSFPAFPTFPGNYPQPLPSIPAPFPHPFPTAGPSVTPTPKPVPTATNIYGYVKDANDTRIPGVYALLQNPSGATYSSTSDVDGYYMICHVPFGNYTISYLRNNTPVKTASLLLNRSTQKVNVTISMA